MEPVGVREMELLIERVAQWLKSAELIKAIRKSKKKRMSCLFFF